VLANNLALSITSSPHPTFILTLNSDAKLYTAERRDREKNNEECFKGSATTMVSSPPQRTAARTAKRLKLWAHSALSAFNVKKDKCCQHLHDTCTTVPSGWMLASTGQIVSNANQLCHLCNYVTLKVAALSHALGTILTDEPFPIRQVSNMFVLDIRWKNNGENITLSI
jgi:hypothetical protein